MSNTPPTTRPWPIQKLPLTLLCVLLPLLGALLFFVWKRSHPSAAQYVKRTSVTAFMIYLFLAFTLPRILML